MKSLRVYSMMLLLGAALAFTACGGAATTEQTEEAQTEVTATQEEAPCPNAEECPEEEECDSTTTCDKADEAQAE